MSLWFTKYASPSGVIFASHPGGRLTGGGGGGATSCGGGGGAAA
eukprot:CAMPEP_0180214386 /NCGR_PEP_ID=MMETSP0987-20121128/14875_1 /TAXON_ID=697907 /ORGANISM="non described non described, Strain CCMP2293" /LENGTH=43 /DNA_ID= /DNA_START= /DNA_END= /DNA_ORIENTATION=